MVVFSETGFRGLRRDAASSYAKDPDEINVEDLHHAICDAAGDKELAARVAYENLQSLAGMSRKIQEAVEHSRVLFERRVKSAHAKLLGRAFQAWLGARYGGREKRHRLARVLRRMSRLKQAQAFSVSPVGRCAEPRLRTARRPGREQSASLEVERREVCCCGAADECARPAPPPAWARALGDACWTTLPQRLATDTLLWLFGVDFVV